MTINERIKKFRRESTLEPPNWRRLLFNYFESKEWADSDHIARAEALRIGEWSSVPWSLQHDIVAAYVRELEAHPDRWRDDAPAYYRELLRNRTSDRIDWCRVAEVENWEPQGRNLSLLGESGSGKTTAAWALYARLRSVGKQVLLLQAVDIGWRLSRGAKECEADFELLEIDVLVIDDLGTERLTDGNCGPLFNLFEERIANLRPTVITTNLDGAALIARFADRSIGERIVRRIRDTFDLLVFDIVRPVATKQETQ